jgi:hypothetical protein
VLFRSGDAVRSLEDIAAAEKEFSDRQTYFRELNAKTEMEIRLKSREDFINDIRAKRSAREAEEESRDASLARLRESLDETNIRWKDSGNRMEDVIRGWATVTGSSVEDVLQRMDELNVDTSNVKATLKAFTDETGKDFLDWSETVKGAAEKAAEELKNNAERVREGGWLTLDQEKFLAEKGTGPLAAAAKERITTKAETFIEEAGFDPNQIEQVRDLIDFHAGRHPLAPGQTFEDMQLSMAKQLAPQVSSSKADIMRAMIAGDIPIKAMARGGLMGTSGLALVGEQGPELVSLPSGAFVHPSGTGPGGVNNNFIFNGAVYGVDDLREAVVEAVRDHAISGGFAGVFAGV